MMMLIPYHDYFVSPPCCLYFSFRIFNGACLGGLVRAPRSKDVLSFAEGAWTGIYFTVNTCNKGRYPITNSHVRVVSNRIRAFVTAFVGILQIHPIGIHLSIDVAFPLYSPRRLSSNQTRGSLFYGSGEQTEQTEQPDKIIDRAIGHVAAVSHRSPRSNNVSWTLLFFDFCCDRDIASV